MVTGFYIASFRRMFVHPEGCTLNSSKQKTTHILLAAVFSFVIVAGWFPVGAHAYDCTPPTFPPNYFVVEGLQNDASQDLFKLYLSDAPAPSLVTGAVAAVKPKCVDETKALNMYNGSSTVLYSNLVGGAGFPSLQVMSTCHDAVVFNVIQNPNNFSATITDGSGNCLAFAPEETVNDVRLVSCVDHTTEYAVAHKSFFNMVLPVSLPDGTYNALGSWNATVLVPATTLPTVVLPFLMALKDNSALVCALTNPPAPPPSGLSSAAVIVIAVLLSSFAAVGVYLALRRWFRRSDYAEFRQAMNREE